MARATRRGVDRRGAVRVGASRVRGQRRTRPPAMGTESGWKRVVVVAMETEVEGLGLIAAEVELGGTPPGCGEERDQARVGSS